MGGWCSKSPSSNSLRSSGTPAVIPDARKPPGQLPPASHSESGSNSLGSPGTPAVIPDAGKAYRQLPPASHSESGSNSLGSSGTPAVIPDARKPPRKVNQSLYELYKSSENPNMQIVFFHGLYLQEDKLEPHLSTWKSGDGSCIWPQTWLVEEFPQAHIFCASYEASVNKERNKKLRKTSEGSIDMYIVVENLLADILNQDIGQASYCPVVLVGHCFGGLVIQQLCLDSLKTLSLSKAGNIDGLKLEKFLKSLRGIFYFGTPHHGSPLMDKAKDRLESPLLKYFELLSAEGERLNYEFYKFQTVYSDLRIHGLGENLSAKSGMFKGLVGAPETTSRAGDSFHVVPQADHTNISRPASQADRRFYGLTDLLKAIATDLKAKEEAAKEDEEHMKQEAARLSQNFPRLPKQITGIDDPIREVEDKLVNARTLHLVGMGGSGKTTLAKAFYNKQATEFEYSAFVFDVKLISGGVEDVKKAIWSQMHHRGQQIETGPNWSILKTKTLLLVLDDVSRDRELEVLFDIRDDSAPESRFIVTSRDWELAKKSDHDVYEVPLLNEGFAKELFMKHAFPGQAALPELEHLADAIVKKCGGLPLALEVFGKYLHKKKVIEDWEQTLDALDKADAVTDLEENLWEKLKWSFDVLKEEKEQQMFLDVACFFRDSYITLREAKIVWKGAYAPVKERLLWQTLVDRSLVYDVEEDERIQLHEQWLSLGRRIGAGKDQKRCRLWDQTEAMELLQSTSAQKEIFALRLDLRDCDIEFKIASSALLGLREVRYLDISGGLSILVFFGSDVYVQPTSLDFGDLSRLSFLNLSYFSDTSLPDSISKLSALKFFQLTDLKQLKFLPEDIDRLKSLQILKIYGCKDLKELPNSFGDLSALSNLQLKHCRSLSSLPESFGNLSALSDLEFESCSSLDSLPESCGNLSALSHLQFTNCEKLYSLPESFGQLLTLKYLHIESCRVFRRLPNSFGRLTKLEDLKIWDCLMLDILPNSFDELSALRDLSIERVGLRAGFLPTVKELLVGRS